MGIMTSRTMVRLLIVALVAFLALSGQVAVAKKPPKPVCGNGVCETGEDSTTCPDDCGNYVLKSITPIAWNGVKGVDWSATRGLIAFGRADYSDGYYDVWVMDPDGSDPVCLTCDNDSAPGKHCGNPAWHPSGDSIVFTAENPDLPDILDPYAIPGRGLGNNLWLISDDGASLFQLTDYPLSPPYVGVVHPQFSHDGNKLFWGERIADGDSFSGGWVLKLADFVVSETEDPHLENVEVLTPGAQDCFYEGHDFSFDDGKVLFSGNLLDGQIAYGLDIYELDLDTGELVRLTSTDTDWDEHAHYSPDDSSIAWMSSMGFRINWRKVEDDWRGHLITELWIMGSDGSHPQQITHFNDPAYPEYLDARAIVSDISWGPDPKRLVALVAYEVGDGLDTMIVIIELE